MLACRAMRKMRGVGLAVSVAAVLATALAGLAAAQGPAALPGAELVDRILAVVNDDPILASDLDRVIGLDLAVRAAEESEQDFRRRVLDLLIDEKLRFQELDRFGFEEVPIEEVEEQFEAVRSRFRSEAEFERRLRKLGLDAQGLRQLIARQLMVLIYVDERLGPRVFVGLDEIRAYYNDVLTPELRSTGQSVPPIEAVREQIRAVVKEQRLNEEIERWTDELRLEADIADYFDAPREQLPARVVQPGD